MEVVDGIGFEMATPDFGQPGCADHGASGFTDDPVTIDRVRAEAFRWVDVNENPSVIFERFDHHFVVDRNAARNRLRDGCTVALHAKASGGIDVVGFG